MASRRRTPSSPNQHDLKKLKREEEEKSETSVENVDQKTEEEEKSESSRENVNWKAEEKEILKGVLENVNWSTEKDRAFFTRQFESLIEHWEGQLPNLRDMFQPGETEHLVSDCVKYIIDRGNYKAGISEFKVLTESVLPRSADSYMDRSTLLHIICKEEFRDTYNFASKKIGEPELINNVRLAKMFLHINGKLNEPVRIDSQDRLGNAPLHLAILHSKRKLPELLLESDADPNLANREGLTPLHLVCRRHRDRYEDDADQYVSLIESFFKMVDQKQKTLKLDARDKKGRTALQLAVANLLPAAVGALLRNGADLSDFVFPADFGEFLESFKSISDNLSDFEVMGQFLGLLTIPVNGRKFEAIVDAVAVVRRLNLRKYDLKRSDALTMMKLFAECGWYELSADLDGQPWYDDDEKLAMVLKEVKIRNGRSFYDLVQLPLDEACKQYEYRDYLLTHKLSKFLCRHWGVNHEKLDARLGAILLRGLLQKFAAVCCSETIVDNRTNKDFYHMCLAAAGESP